MSLLTLHLLRLSGYPIFQQLQLEEALLRADNRNWCLINTGTLPAIVLGISGQPEQWLNRSLLQKRPVPLVRRFSGGGTVFVDRNTSFVTWICQADTLKVPCCPQKVLRWTEGLYAPLFQSDFRAHENDYILGDRKFGGNAQYMRKNRWLHHSSLLWDYDPHNMEYLTIPPRMPQYRKERPHSEFLCKLNSIWEEQKSLSDAIVSRIKSQFQVVEVDLKVALEATHLPHRKATTLVTF